MANYGNYWYAGWGWMLWFGVIFFLFSSMGNWGYTYQAHRKYRDFSSNKDAMDILAERYVSGKIQREEFLKMKEEILQIFDDRTRRSPSTARQMSSSMKEPIPSI